MADDRTRPTTGGAAFATRLGGVRTPVLMLVPIVLLAIVSLLRALAFPSEPVSALTAGAEGKAPAELKASAADEMESATTEGGTGYTFEIVQRSTLVAREDGPPLEAADATDPSKVVTVPSMSMGTYLERGFVSPDGFYAEIRRGPEDAESPDDWSKAPMEFAALVRDGATYRNDGAGWYPTEHPPGLGLDPTTAALLPTMLRALTDVAEPAEPAISLDLLASPEPGRQAGDPFAELAPSRRLTGSTKVDDLPGIIAVDLADATELLAPVELAFDDTGRLVGLRVTARNITVADHDLVVDTVITFTYPDAAPELPKPDPAYVEPSPAPDGGE